MRHMKFGVGGGGLACLAGCRGGRPTLHSEKMSSFQGQREKRRAVAVAAAAGFVLLATAGLAGCRRHKFPSYPAEYREFAYVSDGASNTVAVLDLVYLRQDRVLQVGTQPTGMAVNKARGEVYVVNSGSDSVSVIDTAQNRVSATIGVHRQPYFMDVAPDGKRGYVANSGSNTVSVLDLEGHRELATAATGEQPGMATISPDGRSLVVTNRGSGSVSVYDVLEDEHQPLKLRGAFPGCAGATAAVILPDSTKAFVACSGGHQVMVIWLGVTATSWRGKQDATLQKDHMLALLDVGTTPTHLAMKPNGDEIFVTNFGADSISEISTWTNEVVGTYVIGSKPSRAVVSSDNSTLWVSNFGADAVSLYGIDDGKIVAAVRTGSGPDALAFSADEHLLLTTDARSGDVAVIRTQGRSGAELVTLLPAGSKPNDLVVQHFSAK